MRKIHRSRAASVAQQGLTRPTPTPSSIQTAIWLHTRRTPQYPAAPGQKPPPRPIPQKIEKIGHIFGHTSTSNQKSITTPPSPSVADFSHPNGSQTFMKHQKAPKQPLIGIFITLRSPTSLPFLSQKVQKVAIYDPTLVPQKVLIKLFPEALLGQILAS